MSKEVTPRLVVLLIALLSLVQLVHAQTYTLVVDNGRGRSAPLYLHALDSSQLTMGTSIMLADRSHMVRYPVRDVEYVFVRRKNAGIMGAAIGTGVGALVGLGIGYAVKNTEDECHQAGFKLFCGSEPALGTALGGTMGLIIGTAIGASRTRIHLNGRYSSELEQYVLRPKNTGKTRK